MPSIPITSFEANPAFALLNFLQAFPVTAAPEAKASSPKLQAFIDAIPVAGDGDVIFAEHHNSLRDAIAQIIRALDETQFASVVTESFLPVLARAGNGSSSAWTQRRGFVVGTRAESDHVDGWMPLELPHGMAIDSLVVRGRRGSSVGDWVVSLRRIELADGDETVVCTGHLEEAVTGKNDVFTATFAPDVAKLTQAQAAQLRGIDTSRFAYLFSTEMTDAEKPDEIELRLVQVACTRG